MTERRRDSLIVALSIMLLLGAMTGRAGAERAANGDATETASMLAAARSAHPDRPDLAFNHGVALYRAGDTDGARRAFEETLALTRDPALRARAAYNLGVLAHRSGQPTGMEAAAVEEAAAHLERAIEHYRDALALNPSDVDAQANGEIAWRLLEALRAQQQQNHQQQQDEPSRDDQPRQGEPQRDDQPQQGEPQRDDQPPQDEPQRNDQPQQGEPQRDDQPPQDEPQRNDQPQQGESPQPSPDDGEGRDDDDLSPPQEGAEDVGDEPPLEQPDGLTREEADRLLQIIRDRAAQRAEEARQRRRATTPPVERDW